MAYNLLLKEYGCERNIVEPFVRAGEAVLLELFSACGRPWACDAAPKFKQSGTCPPFPHFEVRALDKFWSFR